MLTTRIRAPSVTLRPPMSLRSSCGLQFSRFSYFESASCVSDKKPYRVWFHTVLILNGFLKEAAEILQTKGKGSLFV